MVIANICTETVEGEQAFVLELWRGDKKVSAYLHHEASKEQITTLFISIENGHVQDALTLYEALKWLMEDE